MVRKYNQQFQGRNRNKTNISKTGNGLVTKSSFSVVAGGTNPFGTLYIGTRVSPSNPVINPSTVYGIGAAYEFFRIRNLSVEFVPSGGSTYNGSAQFCFVDNPELQYRVTSGTDSVKSDIITNTQNVSTFPLNEPYTHHWSQGQRVTSRTWYSINTAPELDLAEFDRCSPCTFAAQFDTPYVSTPVLGRLIFHITYEYNSLGTTGINTFLTKSISDVPALTDEDIVGDLPVILFQRSLAQGWPQQVILKAPELGNLIYVAENPS